MSVEADEIWAILKGISETNKELSKAHQEFKEEQKALQAAQVETDRILNKLSADVKEVSRSVGRLSNRLGEFVEEAVRPSAVRLFRERGIDVHEVHQNVTSDREGSAFEIDLLVVNNQDVVAIECKSNLSIDDVNEHLERLEKIKVMLQKSFSSTA